MSEPIKVGDLVQVWRGKPCCGWYGRLGEIYVVIAFRITGDERCSQCGTPANGVTNALGWEHDAGYSLYRLKKIPPLNELDDVKREEEVNA